MALFEIETPAHIVIAWAETEEGAKAVLKENYPTEDPIRVTKRPRDAWVISKAALGLTGSYEVCDLARECLSKAAGDKLHAIRIYMKETGADLEHARKMIESNIVYGW